MEALPAARSARGILVIPAFNEAPRLPAAAAAIAAQDLALEVAVVDDGSRDDTAAVALRARAPPCCAIRSTSATARVCRPATSTRSRSARPGSCRWTPTASTTRATSRACSSRSLAGECDLVIGSRFLEPTGYHMDPRARSGRRFFTALARAVRLPRHRSDLGLPGARPARARALRRRRVPERLPRRRRAAHRAPLRPARARDLGRDACRRPSASRRCTAACARSGTCTRCCSRCGPRRRACARRPPRALAGRSRWTRR